MEIHNAFEKRARWDGENNTNVRVGAYTLIGRVIYAKAFPNWQFVLGSAAACPLIPTWVKICSACFLAQVGIREPAIFDLS